MSIPFHMSSSLLSPISLASGLRGLEVRAPAARYHGYPSKLSDFPDCKSVNISQYVLRILLLEVLVVLAPFPVTAPFEPVCREQTVAQVGMVYALAELP